MENYTIYCTDEQTRKAIELGAPIKNLPLTRYSSEISPLYHILYYFEKCYPIPTAEQMIGWLEEQGLSFQIMKPYNNQNMWLYYIRPIDAHMSSFASRKEATLAAIDTALDYLV